MEVVLIHQKALVSANKQTVVVTGATGFIGEFLAKSLVDKGFNVRTYCRRPISSELRQYIKPEDIYEGELTAGPSLLSALKGVSAVFHVAGLAHSGHVGLKQALDVNLEGTKSVYSACIEAGVGKLIYFSTILVTGLQTSAYVKSKRAAEEFLLSHENSASNLEVTVLRPASVYGPRMKGNLRTFVLLAKRGLLPALPVIDSRFPLISLSDLCDVAITESQKEILAGRISFYDVTDGQEYTPNRIEDGVYDALGRSKPALRIPKVALFLAATLAHMANFFGIKKNDVGLSLYRNLMKHRGTTNTNLYHFAPTDTLEQQMPAIIDSFYWK